MTFFDQVLTDRITAQAREVHFWRAVLTAIAAVLFGIGWASYKALAGAWFAITWCLAALKVGWQQARTDHT